METKYIKDCTHEKDFLQINFGTDDNVSPIINKVVENETRPKGKTCCAKKNKPDKILAVKDIQGIKLNLDGATKAQLTPKYIQSQDKSIWSTMRGRLIKLYENENENQDKIMEIATELAEQLKLDEAGMNDQSYIMSSAGLFAPRTSSHFDKKYLKIRNNCSY